MVLGDGGVDPTRDPRLGRIAQYLRERRPDRIRDGVHALDVGAMPTNFGASLVALGEADGAVAGAVVTTAGRLPFKGVIHAVGPRQGEGDEEAKLVLALTNSFQRAKQRGWESVSFPAVSSGIFAVPLDVCARAYAKAARASPLANVRLCLRDQPVIDAVLRELGK